MTIKHRINDDVYFVGSVIHCKKCLTCGHAVRGWLGHEIKCVTITSLHADCDGVEYYYTYD